MGLLDAKLDKARAFELLRKKGATKAELSFEGGHDEGSVDSITLTVALAKGGTTELDLPTWYCGGYRYTDEGYVPLSEPANDDEELADLLEGPINELFGSWGSVPSTQGTLTWDVEAETAVVSFDQESEEWVHEEYALGHQGLVKTEGSDRLSVVIEPPADHPNSEMVTGERIPAVLEVPKLSPWHKPLEGWTITQVEEV